MNYDDYDILDCTAECTACHEYFDDGAAEGYTICTDCGCPEVSLDSMDACHLENAHEGPHVFAKPDEDVTEPTEDEIAEVLTSIGKAIK